MNMGNGGMVDMRAAQAQRVFAGTALGPSQAILGGGIEPPRPRQPVNELHQEIDSLEKAFTFLVERLVPQLLPDASNQCEEKYNGEIARPNSPIVSEVMAAKTRISKLTQAVHNVANRFEML